jgi:RNA polymerase subunit RPABC4/transcription elongation factor Spt4
MVGVSIVFVASIFGPVGFVIGLALVVWIALCCAVGSFAKGRGYESGVGFLAAFFLSPLLAVLIFALIPAQTDSLERQSLASGEVKKCPFCAELIRREAIKCRYCGSELTQSELTGSTTPVERQKST